MITHAREKNHGFTLIELTVVMAIISLLVGLSVAGLTQTRHASRTAICKSNERQIGTLLQAYLVDSKGILPTLTNRSLRSENTAAIDTIFLDQNDPNLGASVMKCPSDDKKVFDDSGTSYYWNFTINGQNIDKLFSVAGGSDPHRVPILSDKEGWHPELDNRVNLLYADAHIDQQLIFAP